MNGNLLGEEFESYVFDQISQRQNNQYSGYEELRTPQQIQYLNNTTAWVKLASGVEFTTEENGYEGIDRLKGLISDDNLSSYNGKELARKTVLFNGLTEITPTSYKDGKKIETLSNNISRAGYSQDKSIWNSNTAYGLGGPDFGQQPMPGIQSVNIKSLNRGSIREANIKLKAYNKNQFAIIELLYLRIGFTMMLEWGNDKFINNKGEFKKVGNTIIEDLWFIDRYVDQATALDDIERYREYYDGNYDGFFGKVSNFTWTFASDGSYDIDLKLITMGEVVESLQLNVASSPDEVNMVKQKLNDIEENESDNEEYKGIVGEDIEDNPIVNAAQTTLLGKYLFDSISWTEYWWAKSKPEYFSVLKEAGDQFPYNTYTPNKYSYYMTFGELIRLVKSFIIKQVQNGDNTIFKQINIDNDEADNKVVYYPNQISLDPRVCIFKYKFGGIDLGDPLFNAKKITTPEVLDNLKPYVEVAGKNIVYGNLMNIYINYDFISKCLNDVGKKNKISVFKFFQKICDGINSSLGGVNNIEPIIKDDLTLTFIDQNPIPGYLENFANESNKIVDLEVYGINSANQTSNFVKDISFKTSITPELSSIISIGTTAGGSSTNDDATAFSYWNTGLRDRYQNKIIDPEGKIKREKEDKDIKNRVKVLAKKWEQESYYVLLYESYDHNWKSDKYGTFKMTKYKHRRRGISEKTRKDYPGLPTGVMSVRQFVNAALEIEKEKATRKALTPSDIANQKSTNYIFLLAEAFGGETGLKILQYDTTTKQYFEKPAPSKSPLSANYFKYDEEFIKRSKSTFKVYLNSIKNLAYKNAPQDERTASGTIGFIPVGFNLTLQGISGIKIYNKLNINSNFLPPQYPKALKFIITKVDHKIENNVWETSLDTISIPKTKPYKKANIEYVYKDDIPDLKPPEARVPMKGSGELIYRNQSRNIITKSQVLELLNPDARSTYNSFFTEMESLYKGHEVLINSVGRSIEKSKELSSNSKNAKVGRSRHNYYASIDFNIQLPNKKYLRKKIKDVPGRARVEWINYGFRKLAAKHNLIWGGNFSTYEDCVHFAYRFNMDTAVANAIKKYGEIGSTGIPNLSGDKGKNVKLNKLA